MKRLAPALMVLSLAAGCVSQPRDKGPKCPSCNGCPADQALLHSVPVPLTPRNITPANAHDAAEALDAELKRNLHGSSRE